MMESTIKNTRIQPNQIKLKKIALAKSYEKEDDFEKALGIYQTILKSAPEDAGIYLNMGAMYLKLEKYDEAEKYFNSALHINENIAEAAVMLANLNMLRGNKDKAIKQYIRALEINPKMCKVRLTLGRLYAKQGMFEEAESSLRQALRYNPQFSEARLMLSKVLHRQEKTDTAIDNLEKMLVREPDSWAAYLLLGWLLGIEGNKKEAVDALKNSIELKPDNATSYFFLGDTYLKNNSFEQAINAFTEAINIDPHKDIFKLRLIRAYIKTKDYSESEKILHEMSLGNKRLGIVHLMFAEVYFLQHKYLQAVEEYEAGLLHANKLTENHPKLLSIQEKKMDNKEKAEAYKEALAKINSKEDELESEQIDL